MRKNSYRNKYFLGWYVAYILLASWLPESRHCSGAKKIRRFFAKHILKKSDSTVNIERYAHFGPEVEVGYRSGIGVRCKLYGPVIIGDYVMMGPECMIYTSGHKHDRCDIPMMLQGFTEPERVLIKDDVWIGARCMIMPGVTVAEGTILAAGSILTKDTEPYTIWAGVPARMVKCRKTEVEHESFVCD